MQYQYKLERISPEKAGISSEQVKICIEKLMNQWANMNGFMAAKDGKVFAECFWTPYHKDLVHSNHSLGKTYTGTAVGIALLEGKLSLDERMTDIFQEEIAERNIEITEMMKEVTIRDVLTMTNGHSCHPEMGGDWIGNYFRTPIKEKPGTKFLYNTSGSCMLAAVVKKKTGENIKEYLTPRLFEKIGIDPARFVWLKWPNGIEAAPGTFATTEDNLRLCLLYMYGGKWNGEQLIDPNYVQEALSVQISTADASEQKDGRCGYGYQLWACSIPGVYRFDGGQGQYGIIWPEKKLAVAVHEGAVLPYGPQMTLDVIYEELLMKIADEPLTENPDEFARLLTFEKNIKMPEDPKNTICPEVCITGTYQVLEGNPTPWLGLAPPGGDDMFMIFRDGKCEQDLKYFTLELQKEYCKFQVNGQVEFLARMDGKLELRETENVFTRLTAYCATARFINGYTLEITIHWMNSWAVTVMRFEKHNKTVNVTALKYRANQENNWLVYKGKARGKVV